MTTHTAAPTEAMTTQVYRVYIKATPQRIWDAITQPEWAPDGSLVISSDRTGWSNLYRVTPREGSDVPGELEALTAEEVEFAGPQWVFGLSERACDAAATSCIDWTRGRGRWSGCRGRRRR